MHLIGTSFQHMWLKHTDFQQVVVKSWNSHVSGNPLNRFAGKLKQLRHDLSAWN